MFREIFRFELRQQLKSPLFWLVVFAYGLFAFTWAGSDTIRIGGGVGNVHRNAPFVVVQMLTVFTLLGMFLIPLFVASSALRDHENGTADLFFSTPVSRRAYLGGRFAAGYCAAIGVMIVVALGMMLGVLMPWVDPARLGPTSFAGYAYGFAVFVLPGLFFLSAMLFLLATLTRSMLSTYIGVIAFFVLWQIALVTAGNLEHRTLGALIDPFGLGAFSLATRYWSASDRNTLLPQLTGVLLANRAIWVGIGVAMIAATLALFRPDREGFRLWRRKQRKPAKTEPVSVTHSAVTRPQVHLRTDARARWTQFLKLVRFDTRGVLAGVAFIVMLAFGLMNLGGALAFSNEIYGTKVYPVTHLMVAAMRGSFEWLLYIIITFYAGELVWRERSHRISDATDAFPLPDWIPLLSKLVALTAVIVVFQLAGVFECVIYQLWRGYHHLELGLYLANIALTTITFVLMGVLALFFQVVTNSKFTGYLLMVIYFVSRIALSQLDFDHHLYNYASAPATPYSDMNGFGHFLAARLWFSAYWGCLAVVLLVVAALYWVRGTSSGWRERGSIALARFHAPSRALFAAGLLGFVVLGGWIFYNTNVINQYVPGDLAKQRKADYEKRYRKYLNLPQPKITDVKLDVDIYPHQRRVEVRGHYVIQNKTDQPITDLHVRVAPQFKLKSLTFAAHDTVSIDKVHGYNIYHLKQPLAPGATMNFDFALEYWSRGFRNAPNDTQVVANGTFFNNMGFPHFGYSEDCQLTDRNDRRKYGLGPVPRMPKITDQAARQFNLLGRDADWVNFDATVSTVADQTAIAPGYLVKQWTEKGRRYFHYKMDKPILDFFSFQSARYQVKRDSWNGIALEVYYDKQHAYNVDRMIFAMKKALAHYTKVYSPYQFRQLRILEFPDYESFAQSFANTVPYSESIGFIADLRNPEDIDYVFYVTAHEIGHQWWAHQVIGAYVQGVSMLDETFAQYSALMVMQAEYGATKMRKFLKYELDRYLSGRAAETVEEEPLALVENQPYIHYRKGSVVMYSLQDYLGEDLVDRTLSQFDHEKAFQQPPYTTSYEFLDDLRANAGPQWSSLITDLFNKITLFDDRMVEASAKKRPDGKYDVTMKVHAAKVYVNGVGKETPAKIDEPIDIGVFAQAPDGKEDHEKVLYLAKRKLADGDSTITVTVDSLPYEAGIDPYNKLIDRVSNDNRKRVTVE